MLKLLKIIIIIIDEKNCIVLIDEIFIISFDIWFIYYKTETG